jgi:flagellar biosynthesis/type III secretory pathway protein FliH
MPRTLDNHLTGVRPNAPHPESYRPDLPLRSELAPDPDEEEREMELEDEKERAYERGFDSGRSEGLSGGRREQAARLRELETENANLTAQLAAKAS